MSIKRSAFSVFKAKEKVAKTQLFDENKYHSSEVDLPKLKSVKHKGMSPDISNVEDYPSTPATSKKISSGDLKSEPRFSAIRKSFKKKSKRENHHKLSLKQGGKENKVKKSGSLLQVFDRTNWTKSLPDLNSSSLEKVFLPEVIKQKKEQKDLHANYESQKDLHSLCDGNTDSDQDNTERVRTHSVSSLPPSNIESKEKPPVPRKRKKTSNANAEEDTFVALEITNSKELFSWLIAPVKADLFFSDVWQKKPLFIKRRQPKYNDVWFSTEELDNILRKQVVQFTRNLDIAVYRNEKRETLNPDGRAFAPTVWKFYEEGCSVRLLNPQTFSKTIWQLCSKLQEHFGCFVGSNVYLTPPGSQGFAPHYDDVEAFIIQLEGRKHWKLYASRNVNEVLPRYSSENMTQEELGEPILDHILEPGDALYFPRGVIHQGVTPADSHSLHITVSVYQSSSWYDFMEKAVPMALEVAIKEDVEFRKGLPIGFYKHVGLSNSDRTTPERTNIMKTVQQLMKKLVSYIPVDQAADELVIDNMEEFLPPCLSSEEAQSSIYGNGSFWKDGIVRGKSDVRLNTQLRLVRPGITRLVSTHDGLQIYHTMQHSRQYKEFGLKIIDLELEKVDAVEYLINSYPTYVTVKDVPLETSEEKLSLARLFYEAGLLRSKEPLTQDSQI